MIATLTGLVDGRLPVTGKRVAWEPLAPRSPSPSSATAGASAAPARSGAREHGRRAEPRQRRRGRIRERCRRTGLLAAAAAAPLRPPQRTAHAAGVGSALQLVELLSAPNASVVAVQDGRIVQDRRLAQAREVPGPARRLRRRVHLRRPRQHRARPTSCRSRRSVQAEVAGRRSGEHARPRALAAGQRGHAVAAHAAA